MSLSFRVNYEVKISANTPREQVLPIFDYWRDLIVHNKAEEEFTRDETRLINSYSSCCLEFEKCELCSSKFSHEIKNFKSYGKEKLRSVCNLCQSFSLNYSGLVQTKSLDTKELQLDELKILKGISYLKSKYLIYKHIFNNDIEDLSIWQIINNLQRKGFIWIERDENWKVVSFNVDERVTKLID